MVSQLTRDQQALIGVESAPRPAPHPVNEAMASFWCEMVEDPNPIYFDPAYTATTWLKEPFAPPAMLFTWGMQPVWPEQRHESMIGNLRLEACPTTIAVNATQEYFLPLRYGDRLTITNQVASISEEKTTRLGTGRFVTSLDVFRRQGGEVVGTHSFTLFMYGPSKDEGRTRKEEKAGREKGERGKEALDGALHEALPAITLPLTLRRAIQAVAGTRDYYPFHHDERFARENGADGIFFNTMFLQAFAGRCATEWFGNDTFLRRLETAMRGSNYVGRTLTCEGWVTGPSIPQGDPSIPQGEQLSDGRRLVDVDGLMSTEDGPTTVVKWTVELPPA